MTAKVSPSEFVQNLGQLHSQQRDLKGMKGSKNSKEHHDEAVNLDLKYDEKETSNWIKNNIRMRCSYYMPSDNKQNEDKCQCGFSKVDHIKREVESSSIDHIYTVPTIFFGKIKFVNFGGNIGQLRYIFVRVDSATKMDTMLNLMHDVWGMEKPNLLISVTGSAKKDFNMKPRLRDVFRRCLIKAAHSRGAWIITGGTHAGVMKHVGEAVIDYGLTSSNQKPVVAIGIAPWGVIQNRKILENKEGSWPAEYHIEEYQKSEECCLDPNHSHFILVDDGTQDKYGTEISFRAELERKISENPTHTGDDAVPIVILVLEGGEGTLKTVKKALEKNTPAVIVKGSGRAADILAYAFNNAETVEDTQDNQGVDIKITRKEMSSNLKDDIHKQMEKMNFCKDKDIDSNIQRIEHCLAKSELIHIFEWDSGTGAQDIDKAILKALLKVNKKQVMYKLKLALDWNRIDIAKSEIFTDDNRSMIGRLDDIMLSAIQLNRVNFVELFLDNGVSLKEFLTIKKLLKLYRDVPSGSFLMILFNKMWLKKKEGCSKEITLKEVGQLIQHLLGDYYLPYYISDKKYHHDDNKPKKQSPDFDNPERELFIWSVLNNQQEMAKLFWLHGKDATAAALVAHALLDAMSHETDDMALRAQITENAREFTNVAIGVLEECYSTDYKKAQQMLIRKLSYWGEATCIDIAMETKNKWFISQTACHDLFNSLWMGEMTQENGTLTLLVCIIIPPLIPLLAKFKEQDDGELTPADQTTCSSVQRQKKKQPPSPQVEGTKDDSGDKTKVDVKCLTTVEKFSSFYQAPVVIFLHYVISYMVFLCLYSYILISKFAQKLSLEEIILTVWVFTIFTEEIIQVKTGSYRTWQTKFRSYFTDGWNKLEVTTILLFVIGMILRGIDHPHVFESARIVLGINLVTFFLKLLHIFSWTQRLGPKLVMLIRMAYNAISFLLILMVFIVGYAIVSHAILYPNMELSPGNVIAVFWRPYWNIYGELMLEEVEGADDCTDNAELYINGTNPRCPTLSGKYFVPILMGVYMLCNILLMNVLLSYTFEMAQGSSIQEYWCLHRYSLINKYSNRFFLAPPLNLFGYLYQLIRDRNVSSEQLSNAHELRQWEDVIADMFHYRRELANLESTDYRVKTMDLRVDQLQQALTGTNSENRLETMEKQLQQIIESLNKHHLGVEEKKQKENKAAEVYHMMEGQVMVHTQTRTSPYPETNIDRFKVPSDKVSWDVEFPEYDPPTYTSHVVLARPDWADKVDLYHVHVAERKLQFNAFDSVTNTKRFSYLGNYCVQNGIPLNPIGRTGLQSRGILGRWGPNHAVDPVITRWKYDENNQKMLKDGKPQFEFLAIRRFDTEPWALPESMLAPGHPPTKNLKIQLSHEALGHLGKDRKQKKEIKKQMKKILKKGKLIHKGYADDPRNTDNAWLESTVYLYQDKKNVLRHFSIKATAPGLQATWVTASSTLLLHGGHSYFLKLVAENLDASF